MVNSDEETKNIYVKMKQKKQQHEMKQFKEKI